MMTRWFAVAVCLVSMFVAGWSSAEVVDAIVATVGNEVILQSELIQEIAPTLNEMRKTVTNEDEFNKIADQRLKEALEQAIESKILLREAQLAGAKIKDEAVEERIADIKKRFASNEEFLKELEKAGENLSDLRTRVQKQLLAISMAMQKRRDFEKEVEVSEDDVVTYYNDNKDKFTHPERVYARRIFLQAGSDKQERAKAKARMLELKNQLDAGANFEELAKTYSEGPGAEQGGLVGWVVPGALVQNLDQVVFALPEGGVSDVLETEFGYVILRADKKEAAGTSSLDDARTQIEPQLRAERAGEKYQKWITELRKRSRVRVFV